MTESNDKRLQDFFSEASKMEIADNGFSHRVTARLAPRVNWLSRLWTFFCIAVAAVLLIVSQGWVSLAVQLEVLVRTLPVWLPQLPIIPMGLMLMAVLLYYCSRYVHRSELRLT